jgi:hypothetical protein
MGYFNGLTWTSDGRSLVASVGSNVGSYLWQLDPSGARNPERLEIASVGALFPTIGKGGRLAFMVDRSPDFSADGQRIAFATSRNGERVTVWLAKADGSEPLPLTNGPETHQGSPRWSPDGCSIAFDAKSGEGFWSVEVVPIDPAALKFWRSLADGGASEQITRNGGMVALESDDGKTLYYTKTGTDATLYASPIDGAEEKVVADRIVARAFAVASGGVYYLCNAGPSEMKSGFTRRQLARLRRQVSLREASGSTSPFPWTATRFLFTVRRPPANDLMLVEKLPVIRGRSLGRRFRFSLPVGGRPHDLAS